MNKILMLTPEGEEVDVDQKNFEAAISQGLEPALEYVTPQGKTVVVRRKNFDAAEKQGLVMKPLYEARKAKAPSPGPVSSAAAGAAQWSLLGPFREEIAGAFESPMGAAQAIGELFGADYSQSPELQKYRQAKERYKGIEESAYEQEPGAYIAGGGLGFLSGLGGGGGVLGKSPSVAKTIGAGAASGAASGVGEKEGELSDLLEAGLIGGTGGAAFGALGPVIGSQFGKLGQSARGGAASKAYEATGALKSDINKLYERTPEEIGRELLRSDIIRLGTARGAKEIPERIQAKLGEFGRGQKELLSSLDEMQPGAFKTQDLVDALSERAKQQRQLPGAGNQALADRLQKEADILGQVYGGVDELGQAIPPRDLNLTEALELKRAFDKAGRFQSPMSQADAVAAAREARKLANRQIDESVARVGGADVASQYQTARRRASLLQDARKAAEEQAKRDQANLTFGLREMLASGAGASAGATMGPVGAAVGAVGGAALSKMIKSYGASTTAKMLDAAANIIEKEGFQAGMQALTSIYGADAASDIAMTLMESGNFNNPAQIIGSAVLGSDLTRALSGVGSGLGYALEGRSFEEGFGDRLKEIDQNPSQVEGIASMLSAAIPTGRLGKVGSGLVRGVQALDELVSDTGRIKSAPGMMRIKLPDGTEFPSKIQSAKEFSKAVNGIQLPNENRIVVKNDTGSVVEGYIDHPDYPNHTNFSFRKDRDGTWTLNSNFRAEKYKNVPELKGSSTAMRQEIAKAVGGIGSDQNDNNTSIGIRSYLNDPQSLITRPSVDYRESGEPYSKFYTPGDEAQRQTFLEAFRKSYPEAKTKEEQREAFEKAIQERLALQRQREKEKRLAKEELEQIRNTLMNDPRYADMRESVSSRKTQEIDQYLQALQSGDRETINELERSLTPEQNLIRRLRNKKSEGVENLDNLREEAIRSEMLEQNRPLNRPGMQEKRNAANLRLVEERYRGALDNYQRFVVSNEVPKPSQERIKQNLRYSPQEIEELLQRSERAIQQLSKESRILKEAGNYQFLGPRVELFRDSLQRRAELQKSLGLAQQRYKRAREMFTPDKSYEEILKAQKEFAGNRIPMFRNMQDVRYEMAHLQNTDSNQLRRLLGFAKESLADKNLDPMDVAHETIMVKLIQDELARRAAK